MASHSAGRTGSSGTGLPNGAVTSLVADPNDPSTFYAAVKSSANKGATSVYISNNTGASWTPVFTSANSNGTQGANPTLTTAQAGQAMNAAAMTMPSATTAVTTIKRVGTNSGRNVI